MSFILVAEAVWVRNARKKRKRVENFMIFMLFMIVTGCVLVVPWFRL
jgi:hypothetical protein